MPKKQDEDEAKGSKGTARRAGTKAKEGPTVKGMLLAASLLTSKINAAAALHIAQGNRSLSSGQPGASKPLSLPIPESKFAFLHDNANAPAPSPAVIFTDSRDLSDAEKKRATTHVPTNVPTRHKGKPTKQHTTGAPTHLVPPTKKHTTGAPTHLVPPTKKHTDAPTSRKEQTSAPTTATTLPESLQQINAQLTGLNTALHQINIGDFLYTSPAAANNIQFCYSMSISEMSNQLNNVFQNLQATLGSQGSKVLGANVIQLSPLQTTALTTAQAGVLAANLAVAGENVLSPIYQNQNGQSPIVVKPIWNEGWGEDNYNKKPNAAPAVLQTDVSIFNTLAAMQTQANALVAALGLHIPTQQNAPVSEGAVTSLLAQNTFVPIELAKIDQDQAAVYPDGTNLLSVSISLDLTSLALDNFMMQLGALLSYSQQSGGDQQTPATQQAVMQIISLLYGQDQQGFQTTYLPYAATLAQVAQQYFEEGVGIDEPLLRLNRLNPVLTAANQLIVAGCIPTSNVAEKIFAPVFAAANVQIEKVNQKYIAAILQEANAAVEQIAAKNPINNVSPATANEQLALVNNKDFAAVQSTLMPPTLQYEWFDQNDPQTVAQIAYYGDIFEKYIQPLGTLFASTQFFADPLAPAGENGNTYYTESTNSGDLLYMIFWAARVCKDDAYFAALYLDFTASGNTQALEFVEWVRGNSATIFPNSEDLPTTTLGPVQYAGMMSLVGFINGLVQKEGSLAAVQQMLQKNQNKEYPLPGMDTQSGRSLLNYINGNNGGFAGSAGYAADNATLAATQEIITECETFANGVLGCLKQGLDNFNLSPSGGRMLRGGRP